MEIEMKARYVTGKCRLEFAKYANGNHALQIFSLEGEPMLKASVNPPEDIDPLDDDEIAIKEWSENEGVTKSLIDAGVIRPEVTESIASGFVHIKVYRLTPAAIAAL